MNRSPRPCPSLPTVLIAGLLIGLGAAGIARAAGDAEGAPPIPANLGNAVVKVFATLRLPDPYRPWTKQAPQDITASGVVIEGHRILTNAHAVLYASQVQIQASGAGDKISATVQFVAPGIDLAVLKLDDDGFFASHAPIARASALPQIKDAVLAYGFPTGGSSLSITKGIVSRIEFVAYNFPTAGLRIQIDAAINPGNSGGPAIAGDRMIGLAFSRLGDAQNIGYIIPNEEIELFLQDVADGHYDGKPAIYDELQTLENPALRSYLKLDRSVSGLVVHQPYETAAGYPLKEWDVITRIGDTPIDDQGMVNVSSDLRVNFRYLVQKLGRDNHVPLTIVRDGKVMKVSLPLVRERPQLVPDLGGEYPPYFIYGPLVFSRANALFASFLTSNATLMGVFGYMGSPLVTERGARPTPDRQELVVVASPFFPSKLAEGYSNPTAMVVASVNGVHIRSLAHLVSVLRDLKDEHVVFEFDNRSGEALVFPRQQMVAATDGILTDNGVRAQGSPDMLAIWQGVPKNEGGK
ncbi:MAG TPA: trypsin-like peptidase domain-containing protein [Steroidobacteraceae bacterium]|nr:trypsin-like peptidase domain-containing protein [Steroidobacteraceae bacterium]